MEARRAFTSYDEIGLARLMDEHIYSGHENFSESTEEIAPLTEEEKKQRLEELRAKMAEKKAKQAILDKEEQKKNEVHSSPFCTRYPSHSYISPRPLLLLVTS
jgi:hypothetical protein